MAFAAWWFVITITSIPERKATKYFTELEGDRSWDRRKMARIGGPPLECSTEMGWLAALDDFRNWLIREAA